MSSSRWFAWGMVVVLGLAGCGDSSGGNGSGEDSGAAVDDPGADTPSETGAETGDDPLQPVGGTCAAAGDCEEGLVCVYPKGSDERVCVDPTEGWYDDGSRPEVEKAGLWARKRVTDWEAKEALCNDGSPYAYYVSPGVGDDVDNWLLYMKGGSDCFDDESCARRWGKSPQFMRQQRTAGSETFKPSSNEGVNAGVFARDRDANPFRDWTYVYLHYCSSDVFSGSRPADDHPTRFHFRGRAIVEAVIDELMAGIDIDNDNAPSVPAMAEAKTVMVSGGSAGAVGARHNMDWIASALHAVNPDVVTLGLADSVFAPPVFAQMYETEGPRLEFWGQVLDADCLEAHPDMPGLCADSVHITTGGGKAVHLGVADDGHLGVPSSDEGAAVAGVFTFMAQFDGNAFTNKGKFGWCTRDDCASDADCEPGQGCLGQRCYQIQPCVPEYCTPDGGGCGDLGDPPACLGEVATRANECDATAECPGGEGCCPEGEQCLLGSCVEAGYAGCVSDDECPTGFGCARGICSGPPDGLDDCPDGYHLEPDTGSCDQVIGCSADVPCSAGYTCLKGDLNAAGQLLSYGVRKELGGLEGLTDPWLGAYAPRSSTHTAMSGGKFYAQPLPKVHGRNFAQALGLWMTNPTEYIEHIALPAEVPLRLWAWAVDGLVADGVQARTSGTGCADDAILVVLCPADSPCDEPSHPIAGASVGDTGVASTVPGAVTEATTLKLVIALNPGCTDPVLELEEDAYLSLTYQHGEDAATQHTLRVGLPAGPLSSGTGLPVTLYVGADGALWADEALTMLAVKRVAQE